MQSLIMNILLSSILFSLTVEAKNLRPLISEKLISLEVKKRYSKEQTIIYKDKNEFVCRTELNPQFIVSRKFNINKLITQLEKIKKESSLSTLAHGCLNNESVRFFQGKGQWNACLSAREVHSFVDKLSDMCGRSL